MTSEIRHVQARDAQAFLKRVFMALNVPNSDADKVAGLMVEADVLGYDTHGVFRLRQYVNRLRDGGTKAAAQPRIIEDFGATALVDGDNGLGHLGLSLATETAIAKASQFGIGWVGVRGGNHAGPLALYVRPQAEAGMIGMAAAVGSANHVPPFGGTDLLLGTNPIAISAPSGGPDPFLLDMASTVAAMGKIKTLAQRGELMPEGWMVGRDGAPLTDPSRKSEGFLLPIGGPKGFGLSVAIGLLAGVLNGAAFGSDVVDFTNDTTSETNTGQFVMALNMAAFGMGDSFAETTSRIFDEFRASPPLPGHEPVRLPGEGKGASADRRRETGLGFNSALCRELELIARECDIEGPFGSTRTP